MDLTHVYRDGEWQSPYALLLDYIKMKKVHKRGSKELWEKKVKIK